MDSLTFLSGKEFAIHLAGLGTQWTQKLPLKTQFLPSRTKALLTWEHSKAGWGGGRQGSGHPGFSQNPLSTLPPLSGAGCCPPHQRPTKGRRSICHSDAPKDGPDPFAGGLVVFRERGKGRGRGGPFTALVLTPASAKSFLNTDLPLKLQP